MPAATVSDLDILKAILSLQEAGVKITSRRLGQQVGMTGVGVNRRIHRLADQGVIRLGPPVMILPAALDYVFASHPAATTQVRWWFVNGELCLGAPA